MEPQPRCDGQPEDAVPLEPVAGVARDSQPPASAGHPGVESCGTVEGATLTAQPATPPEDPDEPEKNKDEGPEEYCLGVPQQAHGVTVLGRLPPPAACSDSDRTGIATSVEKSSGGQVNGSDLGLRALIV